MSLSGRILITGGAGFLGRGLMRYAKRAGWDCQFVIFSRDEQKHQAARLKYPEARYVVGDILDTARVHTLASLCDYVIHTAAIKYIPECEAQPSEALRVNVDGTRSVMDAARASGVKRVVIISTDKAAAPLNTYGMTKALCERLVHESVDFPAPSGTEFVACRYGNVIGSTGSVWPVFKQQFTRERRLSVTDPNMTRFFIPVDEAVELIVSALEAPAGTVVIPQPKSLRIGALVDHLTELWHADTPKVIGLRDGEKSHEDMASFAETDRMGLHKGRWLLYGPTVKLNHAQPSGVWREPMERAMKSSTADYLSPEDFVCAAMDSEDV